MAGIAEFKGGGRCQYAVQFLKVNYLATAEIFCGNPSLTAVEGAE
jgi:hypothetical protein